MSTAGDPHARALTGWVVALMALQTWHTFTAADIEGGSWTWLTIPVVSVLMAVLLATLVGLRRSSPWAAWLGGLGSAGTAVVYAGYHALPIESAVTNPYPGRAGIDAWIPVIGLIVAGLGGVWSAWRLRYRSTRTPSRSSDHSPRISSRI